MMKITYTGKADYPDWKPGESKEVDEMTARALMRKCSAFVLAKVTPTGADKPAKPEAKGVK